MTALSTTLFRRARGAVTLLTLLALLAGNVLSVTSAAFHDLMYSMLSLVPFEQVLRNSPEKQRRKALAENRALKQQNRTLLAEQQARKAKLLRAHKISQRIAARTARNVATNVSSMAVEAMPYIGIATVVAVTINDVKDGCDTVRDVNEMLATLELDTEESRENEVCGMKVPDVDELLVEIQRDLGDTTDHMKQRASESAEKFYRALDETLNRIFD